MDREGINLHTIDLDQQKSVAIEMRFQEIDCAHIPATFAFLFFSSHRCRRLIDKKQTVEW